MKRTWFCILTASLMASSLVAAEIKVISPIAGESLVIGTPKTISWTFAGLANTTKVTIILWKGSIKTGIIAQNLAIGSNGQGNFNWSPGAYQGGTAAAGDKYLIRIRTADNSLSGISDAFALDEKAGGGVIINPKTFPGPIGIRSSLAFTAPKLGGVYDPSNMFHVTWMRHGSQDANVSITMLRQGKMGLFPGVTLAASAPNSGFFKWEPQDPMLEPGLCRLKIRTLDGKCEALSDVFTVKEVGGIELLAPKGGEIWESGTPHAVVWKRAGNIRTLDIKLYRNGGVPNVLAQGVDAKLGTTTVTPVRDEHDGSNLHCYIIDIDHSGGNTVQPSGCVTLTGNPNLAIGVTYSPSMAGIGSELTFTIKVENKGAVRSQPCQGTLKVNALVQKTFVVPAVDPGSMATVTVTWKLSCPAKVTISVDSGGVNVEADKSNNTWEKTMC